MATYDKYGSHIDIESTKVKIEKCLGIKLEDRDSSYWGAYYISKNNTGESIKIIENMDPIDREPLDIEFSNYPVIIYVDETDRSDEIQELFNHIGLKMLSHKIIS